MSFRGKLQLKPPAWTVHTQIPKPHHTHHETQDNIQVFGDRREVAIHCLGFVSRMQMCSDHVPCCGYS